MKLTIVVLACMALAAVHAASVHNDPKVVVDKTFYERQKFIYEILYRGEDDLLIEEWVKLGGNLIMDKSSYSEYNSYMEDFYKLYKVGELVPKGNFFSIMQRRHILQAIGLFYFFNNSKDWDTLVHNVVWARIHVNQGMFVWSLSMALAHRSDMRGMMMPHIWEIMPQMFFPSKYILMAEKFDWDAFNRQIMFEKELKEAYAQKHPIDVFGRSFFYIQDWRVWQWWKLMGLDDGWHLEEKTLMRENMNDYINDPVMQSIYKNLKMVWMPVDYTRDVAIMNDDSMISYFTEDVGWNAYWYYLNLDYSKVLPSGVFSLDKDRRGEWWIYNVKQILARYYMERLSHGLGEIEEFSWFGTYSTGYDPQLIAYNGNGFTFRKNYWDIKSYQNVNMVNKIMGIERRIYDAIAAGYYKMSNGTVVNLTDPSSMEFVGNLLQGNIDIVDRYFFGYWWFYTTTYLAGEDYQAMHVSPNALMNYETMLRDPLTYSLFKLITNMFEQYKMLLPPYTHEELLLPGVKIVDAEVSKLVTFFDLVDLDVTTLLNDKMMFKDGNLVWDKVLLARQKRLNHKPFTFNIQVQAEKAQKVVVRVFLAPQFNKYGAKIHLYANRFNFLEIDEFVTDLVVGENMIKRSSEEFQWTSSDPMTYSEKYNYLMMAYEGKYPYYRNMSQSYSLFPDRLILPHGSGDGLPMIFYFMISPYYGDVEQYASYDPYYMSGVGSGVRHIDNMPFGYPFDRKIDNLSNFIVPNMLVKNVKIYHQHKYEKYWPMMYEHYGQFDYDF